MYRDLGMPGLRRPSTVPVEDEHGAVRQLPLVLWRGQALPERMRRFWTEPDALAGLIEQALDVGADADVLPAAEQLARIDPDRERRYGLAAVVFARNGLFSRAEELLDRHESLYGESAVTLWARAEVALSGNRRALGHDLLRQALRRDPDASLPLRRLIDDLSDDSNRTVPDAIREIGAIRGGWRARLWIASSLLDHDEADALVRAAVEESRDEVDVLTSASAVLARLGRIATLVDFIAPRYRIDRDRLECGVNLLFGFLYAGRKSHGEALLQRLAPRLESAGLDEYTEFYRTAFRALRDGTAADDRAEPDIELLRAMASAVRQNTEKARRRCWNLLSGASLLVPVMRAWIDVPIFESAWPAQPQLLEIVTGIDSEGLEVAIAFTDERTLRAWGPMRSPCVRMTTRALLELVSSEKECSLLINPAGPTATELALSDIEAFLDGRAPMGRESSIRFLAEPLRREVAERFMAEASAFLREAGIVREAWLFEMVDDRSGVNPAIALDFATDTSPSDARELLLDAPDTLRWDRRRSRRVRFIALAEGRFADYLRAVGVEIPVRPIQRTSKST